MMMELKSWLKQNISRVQMNEELGISKITYDFLQHNPDSNERIRIANYVKNTFRFCVSAIVDQMAEKECSKVGGT